MAGATTILTSASGILSLLDESDELLQQHALVQLNELVEQFWPEIATHIPRIETLYENEQFKSRDLAAVVASKVFYHLEELDDALKYALGAGGLFDITVKNEYVETLVAKCIDEYIQLRGIQYEAELGKARRRTAEPITGEEKKVDDDDIDMLDSANNSSKAANSIDSRLVDVVERMFRRCYDDGQYHQALGIAIESKRLDQVKTSISQSPDAKAMLSYAYDLSQSLVLTHAFRRQLLLTLVELYQTQAIPDYLNVCQCLLFLDDHSQVADILNRLIEEEEEHNSDRQKNVLTAYQIAFDLGENQNQPFLNKVVKALFAKKTNSEPNTETNNTTNPTSSTPSTTAMDTSSASSSAPIVDSDPTADSYSNRMTRLLSILSGVVSTNQYLHFLYEHNHTDLNILKQIKDKLEQRNSVTHNVTVMAHGLLHCGTTVDTFLRDNLEWLGKAQNWAKFTATASIGVIHKGHINESLKLLEPYLPNPAATSGSPYQEGGALYALGLVHQSHGADKIEYLSNALKNANNNEIVQHGACLGLGLCAMATGDEALYEALKIVIMSESAVAGEAAGYAMGLVLLGTGNGVAVEEMLAYAHETQHEKIIRGLSMGIAMIHYGREEEADLVIEQLQSDKDPILRYGAMYAIGLAYACTGNNAAIQKLLHVAVSDVSDDVRRAAVTCLGFVLANLPGQVPRVVSLLAESYNPHVRFGAALAIGIACAAGPTEKIRKDALAVLLPLLKDRVDFVRQGAFIGVAMVLIQHNEASDPAIITLRQAITDAMNIKSDTMTKFGAILASGIVDAGGRNVTISLLSSSGHKKMAAIVGLALFPQFWYWYPLIHFLSLSFTPTAIIGLNKNLEIPAGFTFVSKAPASLFAYPPPIELKKAEEKKEVKHATLSVTAKAKAKARRKEEERKGGEEKMEIEAPSTPNHQPEIEEKKEPAMEIDEQSNPTIIAANATATSTTPEESKTDPSSSSSSSTTTATAGESKSSEEKKDSEVDSTSASSLASDLPPKPKAVELPFHILTNPARITLPQLSTLTYPKQQRYQPVKSTLSQIVLLIDTQPDQAEVLVKGKTPKIGIPGVSDDEAEPPKPFEYSGN